MVAMWLSDQLRHLWWWVRGVTDETYTLRCGRCGYNGRYHLFGLGCRRYVKSLPVPDDEP